MSLANALKKAASKTLAKLGGDITLRRVSNGIYNPTTGTVSETISDTTIKGVLSNVSRSEVNGLIETQDKLLTISAGDITFVPTTKDRVIIAGVEFKIIQIDIDEQNNTPIALQIILR